VSATIYPKGYKMVGNDGNTWVIILDSRGTHRWQKVQGDSSDMAYIDKVKSSIRAMKLLMEDDPSMIDDIKIKLDKKIRAIELLLEDGKDEELSQALYLFQRFRAESFKFGGRVKKRNEVIRYYEDAIDRSNNESSKNILRNKLQKLKTQEI
jgi:hypothetical protein